MDQTLGLGYKTHMTEPFFLDLRLLPHRSLGPNGFRWLMIGFAAICGLAGLRFLALGAWPVALFFVLDIGLVYAAFRLNFARGRQFEDLRLDNAAFTIRQVNHWGSERCHQFNPDWVRVALDEPVAHDPRIMVRAPGQSLLIGGFLPPAERAQVVAEIHQGFARYARRFQH
jgi:uncharacterized membrane protein